MVQKHIKNNKEIENLTYDEILELKKFTTENIGIEIEKDQLNNNLFDFQKDIIKWALKKGRCALFEDTGLGKTLQQLEFAYQVHKHENKPVLILAPLAVSKQTVLEGAKFGINVNLCENQEDVINGINITNYEKIHKFDTNQFVGIILDESSILKSYSGKTTNELIDRFSRTKYKLCCTATPSPNDYTELGTTSEFLGVKKNVEMLAMFFINDASHGNGWRLKKHAEKEFYKWIGSWAVFVKNPENLGYNGDKYKLPKLNYITEIVESENDGTSLFVKLAETLSERRQARKDSLDKRVNKVKEIIEKNNMNNCLIWCNFNDESEALKNNIADSVEVKGSDTAEHKEKSMIGFANNEIKNFISKPSICGFGMNWQNCNNIIFCGISDSYEQFYQAIRRCWRFGQSKEVNVYIVLSEAEMNVLENIKRKQENHERMTREMVEIMEEIMKCELKNYTFSSSSYEPKLNMKLPYFLFF